MMQPDSPLERYLELHCSPEPAVLTGIRRRTHLETVMPRMLSGPVQGRLLALLAKMIRPKRVLEIGTFTGYGTLCLAEGLDLEGSLITLEINEEFVDRNRERFREAGLSDRIVQYCGNALDLLPQMQPGFDLAFLDADKINYPAYLDLIVPLLTPGGWLIADNVLWNGKVFEIPAHKMDPDTAAIAAFNDKIRNNSSLEKVMLPVRDGLYLIRKCL